MSKSVMLIPIVNDITVYRLSKLQRWMLARAAARRISREFREWLHIEGEEFKWTPGLDDGIPQVDLFYAEVMAGFYGFKRTAPRWSFKTHFSLTGGSKVFKPELIGHARYNAAGAAISRAVLRLQSRGLVECLGGRWEHWAGFRLTEKGFDFQRDKYNRFSPV